VKKENLNGKIIIFYKGILTTVNFGDGLALLGHSHTASLCGLIKDNIGKFGNYLNVSYFISNEKNEKIFQDKLEGFGKAMFDIKFSELEGYPLIEEKLQVGERNLLEELSRFLDNYIFLKIVYTKK
jgi:hypothetical protein